MRKKKNCKINPIARKKIRELERKKSSLEEQIEDLERHTIELEDELEELETHKSCLEDDVEELEWKECALTGKIDIVNDEIKEALSWRTEAYKTLDEQLTMMRVILEQIVEAQHE